MGERCTKIVMGCYVHDAPDCPHEDGWVEWALTHPQVESGFGPFQFDVKLDTSYESEPDWLGFRVVLLEYGETWILWQNTSPAIDAWEALRRLALKAGGSLPRAQLIVANDK